MSRTDKTRLPYTVPDWAQIVVAATDVNRSYAISSVIVAFGADQRAAVLWYGLQKMAVKDTFTEIETRRVIYEALAVEGRKLASMQCRPATWIIDAGGSPEGCVIGFAANAPQICGLQAVASFGRGWRNYRPTAGQNRIKIGEQWHRVFKSHAESWLLYNADYWREIAQKGWIGSPGAPGSCSLPAGNHAEFAAQVTREQLTGKDDVGGRTVWIWDSAPGPHDFGDCMHMAFVMAAASGIGTAGQQAAAPKKSGLVVYRPSQRR
jgi:hypothetical protein